MMMDAQVKACEYPELLVESIRFNQAAKSVPRHGHDRFQIGNCDGSSGKYLCGGTLHDSGPRDLQVFEPGQSHSYRDITFLTENPTHRVLYVHPALMQRACSGTLSGMSPPRFEKPIISNPDLLNLFLATHRRLLESPGPLERDTLVVDFLSSLALECAMNADSPPAPTDLRPAISAARDFIRKNFTRTIQLEELSLVAGLSPWRLNRVFSRDVGVPPHVYQTQLRIERAKTLLAKGGRVIDVANQTGFADQSHLSRQFKKLVGVTPSQYRKGARTC